MVKINCGAIPENLLESELFGYERGAFTGAVKTKKGLLELANGSTVFLDEIGEMPLSMQAKLLTFLEDRRFKRVGGLRDIEVNVRVIAATNRDLKAAIARKEGREAPTVLFLRAYSTGVRAKGSDNMTGEMLKDLGCINIADSEDSLLEDLSLEVILEQDPDFIFVTTMGASEEAAMASLDELLLSNPAWASLTAVQEGHFHLLPKDLFHLKPNARWGESYEILADYLYGEA